MKKIPDFKGVKLGSVTLERPEDPAHGDYATNIALIVGGQLKKNPLEAAISLREVLEKEMPKIVEKIEIAGPGFINFFLSRSFFLSELQNMYGKQYGNSLAWKGKKVMVEFTDPNPFKEFHIGHLYSNSVGESISRILEAQGANVKRVNYQGDVGLHVAKALWGMQKHMKKEKTSLEKLSRKDLKERIRFMGVSYAAGAQAYEKDSRAKTEIEALNAKVFHGSEDIKELYEKGRKWSLEYFEGIYKRLGTAFNYYYFESKAGKVGKEIVEQGLKKGIFEKSEGAIIFPGEKYGLHSRVFINSQGLPTYEAKELGLAPAKHKDFKYDLSVIVTGSEVIDYFRVLLKALELTKSGWRYACLMGYLLLLMPYGNLQNSQLFTTTKKLLLTYRN